MWTTQNQQAIISLPSSLWSKMCVLFIFSYVFCALYCHLKDFTHAENDKFGFLSCSYCCKANSNDV